MDTKKIRELNDAYRKHDKGNGRMFLTSGVQSLPLGELVELARKMAAFDDFNEDNDPYGEHDFGAIEQRGVKYFWKIDYYDLNLEFHSEDKSDEEKTVRVLTLLRADEY